MKKLKRKNNKFSNTYFEYFFDVTNYTVLVNNINYINII